MSAQLLRNEAVPPESASFASLAKLAAETYRNLDRNLRDRLDASERQALNFQAAIDALGIGICGFDSQERLTLANAAFARLYGIADNVELVGATFGEIAEWRSAAGCAPANGEDLVGVARAINDGKTGHTRIVNLPNGRSIQISHWPQADGGWIETHQEIVGESTHRPIASARISFQSLIDWVPDYLWVKDTEFRFIVANKALADDNGMAATGDMIGLNDFDLHAPRMAQKYRAVEKEILESGTPKIDFEEFIVDRFGVGRWFSSTKVPLFDDHGVATGLIGISRDVTARKQSEILRDGQARILEMIAMSTPLQDILDNLMSLVESQLNGIFGSVLLMDEDGVHMRHGAAPSMAPEYTQLLDGIAIGPDVGSCGTAAYRREPVIVRDIMEDPLWRDYRQLVEPYGYRSCWSTPVLSHGGEVLGVFAMYSMSVREPAANELRLIDFTTRIAGIAIERKLAADRIQFMANHDVLTGLPNRALLEDRITQAVLYAQRYGRQVTVAFIDLDNFKPVNDTLGHKAGDELLKTVAQRMTGCTRATDTIVRLGGDEFVVVLSDLPVDEDVATETLNKIRGAIAEPMTISDQLVTVTASMGAAHYPKDGEDTETLLANADAAMYRAKELGRDNFQNFYPGLNAKKQDRFHLREELRGALAQSQLKLLYQPQLDLRTGRIIAVEALLRWMHPELGMIMPADFIGIAEETGLIVPIGDWVLREACRQNKAWQDGGLAPISVCVNVSPRQFQDKELINRVKSALEACRLEAKYLELEVTESLIMQDVDQAVATMNELQKLGVQISIDDFGTGYSSLSALRTFPVARLKIDKTFINDVTVNANDQAVASAVISLGRKLNLKVIAEGVETEDQVAFLRKNDCDEMQGFQFSKPVAPGEIEAMLAHAIAAP